MSEQETDDLRTLVLNQTDSLKLYQTSVDELKFEFEMYREQEDQRNQHSQSQLNQLINATQQNAEAIGQLAAATAGVIEVYNASQGAIKVGAAFGRFVKWLSGLAVLGVAVKWVWSHMGGPPFTG